MKNYVYCVEGILKLFNTFLLVNSCSPTCMCVHVHNLYLHMEKKSDSDGDNFLCVFENCSDT